MQNIEFERRSPLRFLIAGRLYFEDLDIHVVTKRK